MVDHVLKVLVRLLDIRDSLKSLLIFICKVIVQRLWDSQGVLIHSADDGIGYTEVNKIDQIDFF